MTRIAKPLIKSAMAAGLVTASMSLSTAVAHAGPSPNWDAVAQCESGGNWAANTGNGKYGGLQFAGHLGRIRRCRQPSSCLSGTTNRSCQSGSRRTGIGRVADVRRRLWPSDRTVVETRAGHQANHQRDHLGRHSGKYSALTVGGVCGL